MTRRAEHVYTDQAAIERINQHVAMLCEDAHVAVRLDDGSELRGIVAARPMTQQFFDPSGREGLNALVRLEQQALEVPEAAGYRDVWLDRIRQVIRLDPGVNVVHAPQAAGLAPPPGP